METKKSEAHGIPKELMEIDFWNTSEEKLKAGFNIWSENYDKVRIKYTIRKCALDYTGARERNQSL